MKPYYEEDRITIYHGDCREILPTLSNIDIVITDPPYGIRLQEHGRNGYDMRKLNEYQVQGDDSQNLGQEVVDSLEAPQIVFAHPMKPWKGKWRQYLVWDKGPAVGGGGDIATCWKQSWELIQIRRTPKLNGPRDEAVLHFHVTGQDYCYHPCQKPMALMAYLIQKTTESKCTILDPFMGSGTTLQAAKELGRKAIGIEIEEKYCEIAARRLAQEVLF